MTACFSIMFVFLKISSVEEKNIKINQRSDFSEVDLLFCIDAKYVDFGFFYNM